MISIINQENLSAPNLSQNNTFGVQLHEKAVFRPDLPLACFTHSNNGILSMGIGEGSDMKESKTGVLSLSTDGGQTWEFVQNCKPEGMRINSYPFICTKKGTLILVFSNLSEKSEFSWDENVHDMPGAVLPTYVMRSLDGGLIWSKPVKLHDEWTGANQAIIETHEGAIVFTSMKMLHNPGRHSVLTYRSEDEGATWEASPLIDLGGVGHHGGVTESALVELSDGKLMQYIRTNWGQFWKALSSDGGRTFHPYGPSGVDASSAPAFLCRLKSGRIAMLWNRWLPYGKSEVKLQGGDCHWSETPVSNYRAELSLSFSEDECESWSSPIVIARNPEGHLSYPSIFEAEDGEIWVTVHWTRYKDRRHSDSATLRFMFNEEHFA
jgi:sialidase-1